MLLNIHINALSLWMLIVFGFQKGIGGNKPQTLKLLMSLTDKNFTDNVIWRMVTKNIGMCGHQCYKDERCRWMAYNSIDNTCQGHNVTYTKQSEGAFQSKPGTRNYLPSGQRLSLLGVQLNSSSIYNWPGVPTQPSAAVDGDPLTWFISDVETTSFPYFHLKWEAPISVTKVSVVKRPAVESRFEDVYVFVGFNNGDINLCNRLLAATFDNKTEFTCPYPVSGDTIKIEHRGPLKDSAQPPAGFVFRTLELAEVEVYGYQFF